MRLPWPFGQRTSSDGSSSAAPAEGPDGPSVSPAPSPAPRVNPGSAAAPGAVAPPTGAWRSLPPIQRTAGPAPLVASPTAFLADVPGHQGLPSIVPQLGHDASPAAPAGLVVARTTATSSLTSSAPMPMKPVPHRPAAEAGTPDPWTMAQDARAGAAPLPATASAAEPAPVRTLAAVAPSATVTPPVRPLTVAPAPVPAPAPLAQRSVPAGPVSTRATAPSARQPGGGPLAGRSTSAADGPAAAPATSSLPLAAPSGATVQRSRWSERPTSSPAATPSAQTATPAPAPRAGLGAPISGSREMASGAPGASTHAGGSAAGARPPGAAMDTPAGLAAPALHGAPGGTRRAGLGAPVAGPLTAAQRATPVQAPTAPSGPATPSPAPRPLPVLPVARRAAGPASTRTSGGSGQVGDAPGDTLGGATAHTARRAASAAPTGPTTVPVLGTRPLRRSIAVQRLADAGHDGPAPEVVAATWAAPAALPDTVASMPLQRSDTDAVTLQRLPDTGAAPGATTPVPMREITFPAAGGTMPGQSPALPGIDAFAGPGLPGPAIAGGQATAAGPLAWTAAQRGGAIPAPVQRTPPSRPGSPARTVASVASAPLTLARLHGPAHATETGAATPAPAGPVGGCVTADPPAPTVQATPASTASASAGTTSQLPAFTATPVVQRVEGAAPPGGDEKTGHSDTELDELAKAIFGRIRNHLRTEVIHEREAKGLTFDAF